MKHDTIAVIDFGGQYAHLIATKVRRLKVYAEIRQPEDPVEALKKYQGIIISGSPALGSQGEESTYDRAIYDLDIPILGFCFGHQEIARHYGGQVVYGGREWGRTEFHILREHALTKGLDPVEQVWMSHFDSVASVGPGFEELGYSVLSAGNEEHRFAAIISDHHKRYGFQFHPEVDDTLHGDQMIANFLFDIAKCTPSWTMDRFVDEQLDAIRTRVGDGSVFLLASGGVDSTVAAKLIGLALGPERLHLLHIDNGLMRKNESAQVLDLFRAWGFGKNLHFVDASTEFLANLKGQTEPEKKRHIIGTTFVDVFQREAIRLGIEGHLLGQGTIYPDTIETGGSKRADVIKTHHNRVPIIDQMIAAGKVIEPLSELYKVEVRELGALLGIPEEACLRHPFPGPGLGVRLLCSTGQDTGEFPADETIRLHATAARYGLKSVVLPIRSVGVKADVRSYERPVLLSGSTSWERVTEAASAVLREIPGINRCVWNLGDEHPTALKSLAAITTTARLDLLREADAIVMEGLKRHGLYDAIWQCPTVLIPLQLNGKGSEFVVIRPVHSERAMTAAPADLPQALRRELVSKICALEGVCGVGLDVTSKPPGTIEWE